MRVYVLFASMCLLLGSCQRGIYIPDKVNSPGFRQGGEGKFDISVKPQKSDSAGSGVSYSSDISYAPINHLGLTASYRNVHDKAILERKVFDNYHRFSKFNGQRIDLAAGYFSRIREHGKYEVLAGYGSGILKNEGAIDSGSTGYTSIDYSAKYSRYFIQCAAGFDNEEIVSFMGGFRLTVQQYYRFESVNPDLKYALIPDQTLDITQQTFTFFEPYIEVQVGYKYIRFNYQVGWDSQVAGPNLKYDAGLPYMTLGLVFYYSPRYFKHNKTNKVAE